MPSAVRAAVAGADVQSRQLAHALQAVVDGVAMGEQPLGGAGDVAVGLQEGLQGAHQLGLVLLVVGHQRLDRLGVEPLQLARVLAHRRQQQPVGAGLLEGQRCALDSALRDVGRQQRLAGGARQLGRVLGDAAAPERERVPREARFHLVEHRLGRTRRRGVVAAGHQHQHLRAGDPLAVGQRGDRAARHGPRPALGDRAHAPAPALVGGRLRMGARHQHARPVLDRQRELLGALQQLLPLGQLAAQDRAQEVPGGRFRDPLGRPHALDLRGDHGQQQPAHRVARLGLGAHVQRPHDRVGDAQRRADHALALGQQRALLGRRARRDRQGGPPRVRHSQARLERPRGRPHHLGQARARLDRLGDRVPRREI